MSNYRDRDRKNKSNKPPSRGPNDFLAFGPEVTNGAGPSGKRQPLQVQKKLTPWADLVRWDDCRDAAEMLHYEVLACVDYLSAQPEEHDLRRLVVEQIRRAVQHEFPDAQVTPFGSYGTNLYLPSGDIDLVIENPNTWDVVTDLKRIGKVLKRHDIAKRITVVAKAKVPIVKFTSVIGNFLVDISVNHTNGLVGAETINTFQAHFPALRYITMIIKYYLADKALNEVFTGGLGSYSIVCMVVSFLQMHPKIRNGEIDPMENLGVLLVEFFELYGYYFHYSEVGISLQNGGTYFSKEERDWRNPAKPWLLTIEDPLVETHDISVGSYNIGNVKKTFQNAFESLTSVMCLRAVEIDAKKSGRYANIQKDRSASSRSIIGCILGVNQQLINMRTVNIELYHKRTIQDLLGEPYVSTPPPPEARSTRPGTEEPEDGAEAMEDLTYSKGAADAAETQSYPADSGVEKVYNATYNGNTKESPSRSLKRARSTSPGEIVEEEDSRYGAVGNANGKRQKNKKDKVALDFVSDDDASDGVRMVAVAETSQQPASSRASSASRRAFWQAKAGDTVPEDDEGYSP